MSDKATGKQSQRRFTSLTVPVPRVLDVQTPQSLGGETRVPVLQNVVLDPHGGFSNRPPFVSVANPITPAVEYMQPSATFRADGVDWAIVYDHTAKKFYVYKLSTVGTLTDVRYVVKWATSGDEYVAPYTRPIIQLAQGNVYILTPTAASGAPLGATTYDLYRLRGVTSTGCAPVIARAGAGTIPAFTLSTASGGALGPGQYAYGVEFARQISSVDDVASSPKRARNASGSVEIVWPGRVNPHDTVTLLFTGNKNPAVEDTTWDVIRFYRSVDILSVDSPGSPDDLYPVQEFTRAQWSARTGADLYSWTDAGAVTDDTLLQNGGLVQYPDMDLVPIKVVTSVRWMKGRFWFGGFDSATVGLWNGSTGKYRECYAADALTSCGASASAISALAVLGDDLLVCRANSSGCIYNADPTTAEYVENDSGVGIPNADGVVEVKRRLVIAMTNVGLKCNSLYEWNDDYQETITVSRALPASYTSGGLYGVAIGDFVHIVTGDFAYHLVIHEESKSLVRWVASDGGHSVPLYIVGQFLYIGTPTGLRYVSQVAGAYLEGALPVEWTVQMPPVQNQDGTGWVEHQVLDISAEGVGGSGAVRVTIAGCVGSPKTEQPVMPAAVTWSTAEGHLMHFPTPGDGNTRIMGERIYYTLSGECPAEITAVRWNGFISDGAQVPSTNPSLETFVLSGFKTGIRQRFVQPDPTTDTMSGLPLAEGS